MKKSIKTMIGVIFAGAICLAGAGITSQQAKAIGETMETATSIGLGKKASCTFIGKDDEVYYFKFTLPKNVGNRWIVFNATNYSDDHVDVSLLDSQGNTIKKPTFGGVSEQTTYSIVTRVEGTGTNMDESIFLVPGNTYYIKAYSGWENKGDVFLSVGSAKDDNWGTFEKAKSMFVGQRKNGKLEKGDDIDFYSVVLPKDGIKRKFLVTSNKKIRVTFHNGNRVILEDKRYVTSQSDDSFTVKGRGQRIYIRIEAEYDSDAPNYSLKVSNPGKKISKLTLTGYKSQSTKIVGKTIGNATVKVIVNNKTYNVKSNKSGKFIVKLKEKLNPKNKIQVSVSKKRYAVKNKTFKVK